ncbi:MAG: hypothetical protein NVS9B13_05880 [Candidatus Acidiferrum sp.]
MIHPKDFVKLFLVLTGFSSLFMAASWNALAAPSTERENEKILRIFEENYRSSKTWKVAFLERYSENNRTIRLESGMAYFLRPGKMRWEYESPEKNIFLVDGKTAWFYVPEDHTVTRVPARQSMDWRTPFAILAGEMKLSRLCEHVEIATQDQTITADRITFSCKLRNSDSAAKQTPPQGAGPQPAPEAATILFEIKRSSFELTRVVVRDPGGVTIEFQFVGWRRNLPLDEELFHFVPLLGVTIVDGFAAQIQP